MISSLELAKLCGVAQATVDRAIHGRPGIAKKTRDRILKEAAKHGYCANPVASELLRGGSRIVGAVMPMFGQVFFADLMGAVAAELASRKERLFISPANDEAGFHDAVQEFVARRVRALVVIPPGEGLTLSRSQTGGLPVVSLFSDCGDQAVFITPVERRTGVDAVKYLWGRGHARIAHLTYQRESHAIREREAGYVEAMKKLGLRPVVVRGLDSESLMRTMSEERPTAWICHNDWLAVRMIDVLQSAGVSVPRDVSVLGVDDSPTLRDVWPQLSTMRYPMAGMARRVVAATLGESELPDVEPMLVIERKTVADCGK